MKQGSIHDIDLGVVSQSVPTKPWQTPGSVKQRPEVKWMLCTQDAQPVSPLHLFTVPQYSHPPQIVSGISEAQQATVGRFNLPLEWKTSQRVFYSEYV